MNHLNSLIIEGNAVRSANISEPKVGFTVCKFPVAVNRWYKNRDDQGVNEVSYFDVEAYGKMAEYCSKKIEKGRGLRVVGHLKQDRWQDDSGKSHSKVYIVAEHIEYKPKFNNSTSDTAYSPEDQQDAEEVEKAEAAETVAVAKAAEALETAEEADAAVF